MVGTAIQTETQVCVTASNCCNIPIPLGTNTSLTLFCRHTIQT